MINDEMFTDLLKLDIDSGSWINLGSDSNKVSDNISDSGR